MTDGDKDWLKVINDRLNVDRTWLGYVWSGDIRWLIAKLEEAWGME